MHNSISPILGIGEMHNNNIYTKLIKITLG